MYVYVGADGVWDNINGLDMDVFRPRHAQDANPSAARTRRHFLEQRSHACVTQWKRVYDHDHDTIYAWNRLHRYCIVFPDAYSMMVPSPWGKSLNHRRIEGPPSLKISKAQKYKGPSDDGCVFMHAFYEHSPYLTGHSTSSRPLDCLPAHPRGGSRDCKTVHSINQGRRSHPSLSES